MDLSMQRQIDSDSRYKIVHNIEQNYFVEAGAGSGKTTVLVERMVAMVEAGIDISKISAITFTKAAANEFYARFQVRLSERANEKDDDYIEEANRLSKPNDVTRNRCKIALANIDLCFMGTIDAFCNMVMSEHPNEGLIPSSSLIIDDDTAENLYKKAYTDILNGVNRNEELREKATRFLAYNDYGQDSFVNILNVLLDHRDCKIVIPAYDDVNLDIKYADTIKTVRKIINTICEHPEYINSSNQDKVDSLTHNFVRYKNTFNHNWNDNIPSILKAYSATLGHSDFRLYDTDEVKNSLKEGIDYFVENTGRGKWLLLNEDKLPKVIEAIEVNKYAISLDFVESAKHIILASLRKQGKLTFNDYLIYLRDTLKTDAQNGGKLIKHIYERHSYFLIDEFQDTDPIQAEIFFYLAAKNIDSDWRKCVPHPGSLFIVGDPKQSIYRFKNADVASFIKVREMFNGEVGEVLQLFSNFRSTYEVKDWFNKTFVNMLTDSEEQASYPLIPIEETEKVDGFTGVFKYDTPASTKDIDEKQLDTYKVKELILKLVDNENYQVYAKDVVDGKTVKVKRKLKFADFMLITPGKPALTKYAKMFKEYGIPYFVEGNIDFKECKAFETLLFLYGAITNDVDNRYLYGILKSSLYQFSEKELIKAIEEGFVFDIRNDVSTLNIDTRLKDVITKLQNYHKLANGILPSTLLTMLIERFDVFLSDGTRNMEYIYYALQLLKSKENSKEIISHKDCLLFLEDLLYTKNNIERCPGLALDGNLVHLANLHKVKGLEAPVVILASPKKTAKGVLFRTVRNEDENKGYLFKVEKHLDNGGTYKVIGTNSYADTLEADEVNSIEAENLRLAYVAATRARNVLIIANSMTKSGPSKTNPWGCLLKEDLLDIEEQLSLVEAKNNSMGELTSIELNKDNVVTMNDETLNKSSYEIKRPSALTNMNHLESDEDELKSLKNIDEGNADNDSTIIGTIVHRLIELLVLTKDQMSLADLTKQIKNEERITDERYLNILSDVYNKLHHGGYVQENTCPQDILPILLDAEEVYPELPFTYKENGIIWNGVIDMLYRKDDKLHIIDWKTNKQSSGLDEYYKKQLAIYTRVVEEITKEKVSDSLIYHIDINR